MKKKLILLLILFGFILIGILSNIISFDYFANVLLSENQNSYIKQINESSKSYVFENARFNIGPEDEDSSAGEEIFVPDGKTDSLCDKTGTGHFACNCLEVFKQCSNLDVKIGYYNLKGTLSEVYGCQISTNKHIVDFARLTNKTPFGQNTDNMVIAKEKTKFDECNTSSGEVILSQEKAKENATENAKIRLKKILAKNNVSTGTQSIVLSNSGTLGIFANESGNLLNIFSGNYLISLDSTKNGTGNISLIETGTKYILGEKKNFEIKILNNEIESVEIALGTGNLLGDQIFTGAINFVGDFSGSLILNLEIKENKIIFPKINLGNLSQNQIQTTENLTKTNSGNILFQANISGSIIDIFSGTYLMNLDSNDSGTGIAKINGSSGFVLLKDEFDFKFYQNGEIQLPVSFSSSYLPEGTEFIGTVILDGDISGNFKEKFLIGENDNLPMIKVYFFTKNQNIINYSGNVLFEINFSGSVLDVFSGTYLMGLNSNNIGTGKLNLNSLNNGFILSKNDFEISLDENKKFITNLEFQNSQIKSGTATGNIIFDGDISKAIEVIFSFGQNGIDDAMAEISGTLDLANSGEENIDLSDDFKTNMLKYHNDYRKQENASLEDLTWSDEAEAIAKEGVDRVIADSCNLAHSDQNMLRQKNMGENVFGGTFDNEKFIIDKFYSEKANYNFDTKSCNSSNCGHYTQLVWKDTKQVGCAIGTCSNGLEKVIFCNYTPMGNFNGQNPY